AVPANKKLIVSYASVVGFRISSGDITKAGCQLRLVTTGAQLSSPFAGLPTHVDFSHVAVSEAMYLPLSNGEGLAVECFADLPTTFNVVLGEDLSVRPRQFAAIRAVIKT